MIEYILLGFIMYREMSGYDLKQFMIQSTANFYEASFGSIYPTLKRLEASNALEVRREAAGKRVKKVYRILPQGRARFLQWMESPMSVTKHFTEPLIRVFFLAHMEPEKAKIMLKAFRNANVKELEHLEEIREFVIARADRFQVETLYYGLEHYRQMIKWIDGIIEKLNQV